MNPQEAPPQLLIRQICLGFVNYDVLYALLKTGGIEKMGHQPHTLLMMAMSCELIPDVLLNTPHFEKAIGAVGYNECLYSLTEISASPPS